MFSRLTESEEFKYWLDTTNSRLWLFGIPGAGKTVLASSVIEETLKRGNKDSAVAFFYCDYKNEASQEPVNVLGGLACHLARQNNECFQKLLEYYRACNPDGDLPKACSTARLLSLILDMASEFDDVAVIVDALDECGKQAVQVEVTELLSSLSNDGNNIKTLFLSRNEQHLRDILTDYKEIPISARSSDLKLYVASEIELRMRNKRLRIKSDKLKEHIMDKLVNGADRMYVKVPFPGD
jgi:NACHT domain